MSTDIPFVNLARVVRTGWIAIILVTVVFAGLGVAGWYFYPQKYDATATVEVTSDTGGTTATTAPNMQTEQTIAQSTGVLVAALDDLNGWTLGQLRGAVAVTVPHDADVLDITVSDSSPAAAAAAANAVSAAYLDDRRTETDSKQAHGLTVLEDQIAQLEKQIGGTTSTVQRQALETRLAGLQNSYAQARANVDEPGRILSDAETPTKPSTPGLQLWLAATIVAGLLVGFYGASLRERFRRARG